MKKQLLSILLFGTVTLPALGQTPSKEADATKISMDEMLEMSLEDLMNVQIVSASKKSERLFDAPLSASVLTIEEIQKAGATSIMEALRLVPGVIVRQETNGNYGIHIRGLDNVPNNSLPVVSSNTTTLVMIDNRPVYNYLQGGTIWESLPIDLEQVEKIEVIRGASSPLYGPNAVSGVINIITRKGKKEGTQVLANAQYGSLNTAIANASVGYQFNSKFNVQVSGNYQGRGRKVSYYDPVKNRYFDSADSLNYVTTNDNGSNVHFPNPDRAMDKYGANVFLNYQHSEKIKFSLASGGQYSQVQNAFNPRQFSSITTALSNTRYADFKAQAHGLTSQISYLNGSQNTSYGHFTDKKYEFDFSTLDAFLEYDLKVKESFSVKPGFNYRKAVYDDTPYADLNTDQGTFRARRDMETLGASVRFDYQGFNEKLRIVGGTRVDKFTHPSKAFLSYQLAANFKPSENNLFRAVYSRAYRSAIMIDTYADLITRIPMQQAPAGSFIEIAYKGNKEIDMLYSDLIELGYRTQLAKNITLDIEAYYNQTTNYVDSAPVRESVQFGPQPDDPIVVYQEFQAVNIPLEVDQLGTTFSLNYVNKHLQVKPFISLQRTKLTDNANDSTYQHKFTPAAWGGAYVNYQVSQKLNVNLSPYFYSTHTYYHLDNLFYNDGARGVDKINAKILLNASVSYQPNKYLTLFVNAKNMLNDKSREFYKTDEIGLMLLGGIRFQY